MMYFQTISLSIAASLPPCFANISNQVMSKLLIEKQAIFTNFPKLSSALENDLGKCFQSMLTNSQWLSCLAELDDDSCICEIYQLANERCIKKYIENADYSDVFETTVEEGCSFGISKDGMESSKNIADYDDSDNFSILSKSKFGGAEQRQGYFDFCCSDEFQYCYKDAEEQFDTCLQNINHASQIKEPGACKCEFVQSIKDRCFQYCNTEEAKFDRVIQQLCSKYESQLSKS